METSGISPGFRWVCWRLTEGAVEVCDMLQRVTQISTLHTAPF